MGRQRDCRQMTAVLPSLDIGGVQRVYVDVLGELCARGAACRIAAPDGPLRPDAERRGINWLPMDWSASQLSTYRRLVELVAADEPTVVPAHPALLHVLSGLIARGPTALAIHAPPARLAQWIHPATIEWLGRFVRAACPAGQLRVLTIGDHYVRGYAEFLGLDDSCISLLPPAVDIARIPFAAPRERLDSVLCLTRLSPEKSPQVRAGIDLVASRLRHAGEGRLDVIGDGPWRGEAERLCAARLPAEAYSFHGATLDPSPALRSATVVVATGLSALEAACAGARVVVVRTTMDDLGALGPVLTPDSYDELARDAFGARLQPPRSAEETWATLQAVTPPQLEQVRACVERRHSLPAAGDALVAALSPRSSPQTRGPMLALGAQVAELQDRLSQATALGDEIWAEKVRLEVALAEREAAAARRSAGRWWWPRTARGR